MTRLVNLAQIGCFVLFSLTIISGCANSPAPLTDTTATDVVIKSPNDQRDYAHVTLDNGMRVLLISDPDADKSAAALVAFRGSFHDPEDRPGLAHFLEHMLFIGTNFLSRRYSTKPMLTEKKMRCTQSTRCKSKKMAGAVLWFRRSP